jgi:hypothetical protein
VIDLDVAPRTGISRRPVSPLLLSAVLVWLLTASGPLPRPAPVAIIPATFLDDTYVDGDRLFVAGPRGQLRIFRLPDAHPLGQIETGYPGLISGVRRVGDVLLVMAGGPRVTMAYDAASGRQLWSARADVAAVSGTTVLLTDDLAIWAVDPHRGTVSWRIDQPTMGSRYLVTAGLDSMTSYDGRTGATTSQAGIHLSGIIYSYVSDSRFVIGDSSGLAAYQLPSLAPLWHVATDPQENRLQPDCVHVLCSYLGDQGVTVRDPATGRTLWSSLRWAAVEPLGPGPGLVGTVSHAPLDAVQLYLLDPATGEPRSDFGGWRAVIGPGGTLRYALHPAATPNDYYFGEFDPAHGTVRIIGTAPQISGHSDVSAGALIYHRVDGSIAVWRFG